MPRTIMLNTAAGTPAAKHPCSSLFELDAHGQRFGCMNGGELRVNRAGDSGGAAPPRMGRRNDH